MRSRTALLARLDLDPQPRRRTTWGYEFYSYRRNGFEKRNNVANPRRGRTRSAVLMAKLAAFDACREKGDQPVSDACRTLTGSSALD